MDDDKKKRVVDLFKSHAKPKPVARHKHVSPAGNVIYVNGAGVAAGQIAGGDIHNHINEQKVVRPQIVRGPGFISSSGAKEIQKRIAALVEIDVAAGEANGDERKLFAKYHKMIKNHFDVASYLEIPSSLEQQAIDWLQTLKVLRRPKIRRANNQMWRNEHYTGIWSRAKQAGKSKAAVYALALERTGKQVVSLKNLGEQDLKSLYQIIMREW